MPDAPAIHPAAACGFDAQAQAYARGRPDYPPALDAWLRDTLGLHAGRSVVDLGAGTGKFVPRLLATGARVTAIEPVAAMRAVLQADWPDVPALAGTAEAIPLPAASVDAVVCAQAFHWFANPTALAEIRRVLRPGGRLGLVWNVRDERVPWVARLTELVRPHEGDAPRYHRGDWRRLFPFEGFGPLHEAHFAHGHTGTPEQVIVERFLSVSFIAALPPAEHQAVAAQLRALIAGEPALAGHAAVTFPYDTAAFCCRRDDA
jgi:SAM-dependent methyltransferase